MWIPKWASALVLGYFFWQAPKLVQEYDLTAGDFMACVKSWMSLRSAIENMIKAFIIIQRSIIGLEKVCAVFNREDKVAEMLKSLHKQNLGSQAFYQQPG
jgi:hypothetical protein